MRCSRARRLLHLNRKGELSDVLQARVLQHASTCPACAAELEMIRRTEMAYTALTQIDPVLRDPEELTGTVMRRVYSSKTVNRWSDLLAIPLPVQRSFQLAAVVLVCAFFSLSVFDAFRMSQLDERLAHVAPQASGQFDALLPRSGDPKELLAGHRVNEAGLLQFVRALAEDPGTTSMMDQFRAKYPGLFSITTEDGLDDRERAILATEGRAFLKDVEHLISMAEESHAY